SRYCCCVSTRHRSMKNWNGEGGRRMPNGVDLGMILAVIIPLFIVTVALRALPFSLLRYLKNSESMAVLGRTMPVGVMTVLVVYTWYGQRESPGGFVGEPSQSLLLIFCTSGAAMLVYPFWAARLLICCWSTWSSKECLCKVSRETLQRHSVALRMTLAGWRFRVVLTGVG